VTLSKEATILPDVQRLIAEPEGSAIRLHKSDVSDTLGELEATISGGPSRPGIWTRQLAKYMRERKQTANTRYWIIAGVVGVLATASPGSTHRLQGTCRTASNEGPGGPETAVVSDTAVGGATNHAELKYERLADLGAPTRSPRR
jgi:hypothetical protein